MNAGKPPSRDWRAHPPAQSVYAREWRGGAAEAKSWFSRKTKVRSLFLLVAIVAGLIVILLAPVADRVPAMQIVTFGIGAYGGRATPTGNMPVNPFGENDARAFLALADEFPDQFLPVRQEDNALNGAQLLSFLEQESQSPAVRGRNLLVFCTLHAIVQPSGTIELFAIDATPDSPSSSGGAMIPLDDVVERLKRSVARRVVLALDASRLHSSWRSGILVNDVAAQVAAEWGRGISDAGTGTGNAPVSILLAASQGQTSWPEGDQSAFARALIEGLSGAADGWGQDSSTGKSGSQDRRVSLQELARFVQSRVDAHAAKTFGARQTVQLVGETSDFALAVVTEPQKPVAKTVAKSESADSKEAKEAKPADKAASTSAASTASTQPPTPAPKPAPPIQWDIRLAEMRAGREALIDSGRAAVLRRRMPFAWRSWETQLELAESLVRGGLPDLAPAIVRRADLLEKSLRANQDSVAAGDVAVRDSARLSLGFGAGSKPPSREQLAAAEKYLQSLIAPAPAAGAAPAAAPAPSPADAVPDGWTIQSWIRQQLMGEANARARADLKKIVTRLDENGSLPPTVEMLTMRDVILSEGDGAQFLAGNALSRLLSLRDRIRRIAIEQAPSLPLLRQDIEAALHALTAAERWMLIAGGGRPETAQWLDQAERTIAACESTGRGYVDTLATWTELLLELPSYATWVAARATDDPRRDFASASLRGVGGQFAGSEQSGQWDVTAVVSAWPDRPARWTDLERRLITLFVDAQRLKRMLLTPDSSTARREALTALQREINLHRRDFQEEATRVLPRLGTGDKPTPISRLEAERLLQYAWLRAADRKSLVALSKMEPQGDPLTDRDVADESVSEGFWAIATLGLLSRSAEDTAGLWKEWDRLAELSEKSTSATSETEQLAMRKRRADLGRSVRMLWRSLQDRAGSTRSNIPAPEWALIAATLDPTILPQVDPDQQLLAEESRQFADWLTVFAADWSQRRWNARLASGGRFPSSSLWEQAGAVLPASAPSGPQWNEIAAPKFDATRRGQLALTATNTGNQGMRVLVTGPSVRLVDAPGQPLVNQSVARPLTSDGQGTLDLKLENEVVTAQSLIVVLGDAEGFPYDFRQVPLNPPFDPSDWRIELVESKTGAPLQMATISKPKGIKVFLPPNSPVSLKANLIRPARDQTSSAKITVYRLSDGNRTPIIENVELKLEAGKDRTPIVMDVPAPPAPADAKDKDKAPPPGPIADLARGWLFEITPDGQSPIEFVVRPTFWSATRFVNPPEPELRDDRFVLVVKRLAETPDDTLLPAKIPIELRLPPSLQGVLKDFTLGGPLAAGQQMTLSFTLPSDWRERARRNNWEVALNVASLPHAFRWKLDPTGTLAPIGGQPPKVNVRLVLPTEPKAPPRLAPILRRGQEPLHLLFEVDAAALDRTEGGGDWTLSYTVVRETDEGVEATPLQHSWRLFSSVEQHVLLDGIQRGVWKLTTAANDYETIEPETEIRGLAGRFQANATLTQASDPQRPVATGTLRFAVDDDAPPDLVIKGLSTDARLITQDLPFRIDATDPESGIEKVLYGFDANADKMLQPDEIMETRSLIGFDNPNVSWPVVIPRSKLPKLEKDEETKQLLVQAVNSGGIAANRAVPVTLKKPVAAIAKAMKGSLVVNLQVSRGAKASIQITGPDARLQEATEGSTTFADLTPGQYQISATVNYAVIGRKEKGEAKVDVKAGETTTANVPLSSAK